MAKKLYRCCQCGETTTKKNEYQCPYCLTMDSLEEVKTSVSEVDGELTLEDLTEIFTLD